MVQRTAEVLAETDETGWLEASAELIRSGRWSKADMEAVAEYLADMARRDKREVVSRLSVLIAHLLKWQYQPEMRSGSWRGTVERERQELAELLESGTLLNHAAETLAKAYRNGVKQALAETGLSEEIFPEVCPYTLDDLVKEPLDQLE
jgi:hypothetical protein